MTRFLSEIRHPFLPPHLGRHFGAGLFFATDPERGSFGRRARAMRGAQTLRRRPEAEAGRYRASRTDWKESRMQHEPSPAAGIAAALGAHAEAVCRRYLPHGRKQGRYWIAGRSRRRPRAVALRPPPRPRRAGEMDRRRDRGARRPARPHPASLARRRCARRSTRRGPSLPCRFHRRRARATLLTRPRRPAACGGSAARSPAPMPRPICLPAGCRAAASRHCASTRSFATATAIASAGFRRWSPPSPATTTPSSAYSAPGSIRAGPPRRASRRRARRSAASTASP